MFTIKQVTSEGEENFWEGINVSVVQRKDLPVTLEDGTNTFVKSEHQFDYDDRIIRFDIPQTDGTAICASIDVGTVYIMNSSGKTIDRYILGPNR